MNRKLFFVLILTLIFQTIFSQQRKIATADGKILINTAIDSIVKKLMDTAGVTGLSISGATC